jgi:hypothetical protein
MAGRDQKHQRDADRDAGQILAPDPIEQAVAPGAKKSEADHRQHQHALEQEDMLAVDQPAAVLGHQRPPAQDR